MWFGIALLSALLFGLSGFFLKVVVHQRGSDKQFFTLLYLAGSLVFLYKYEELKPILLLSSLPWIISIAGIVIVTMGSVFGNRAVSSAYAHGPASLTAPLVGSNVILVIVACVFYYKEHLETGQLIAIALLIIAVSMLSIKPGKQSQKLSIKWWIMIVAAIALVFSREMAIKVLQELHAPVSLILMFAYLVGFVYFATLTIMESRQQSLRYCVSQGSGKSFPLTLNASCNYGLLAGICSGAGLLCLATAMQSGPASIVVPLFSLRSTIVVLLSFWIFRERLARHQVTSLILLIAAVLLIGTGI